MGASYTDQNNPLVRRAGAAMVNFQKTPMSPTGTGSVNHFSDPQITPVHTSTANSRQHFTDWPDNILAKVKTSSGTPVTSKLRLRCRSYDALMIPSAAFPVSDDTAGFGLAGAAGPVSSIKQSNIWGAGDNLVYKNVKVWVNIDTGMQDVDGDGTLEQTYTITIAEWEVDTSGNLQLVSSNTTFLELNKQGLGNDTFLGNNDPNWGTTGLLDFTGYDIYAEFTNELGYADMLTLGGTGIVNDNYSSANQVYRSIRSSSQSAHGLQSYIGYANTEWVVSLKQTNGDVSNIPNGLYTYILGDSEPPYGAIQKNLVKAQWYFEPAGCDACYFAGKTITVEAKFKKALVERSANFVNPSDVSTDFAISINAWADHTTETYTIVLPDSLNAQTIGAEFDFPTIAGHIVLLDDLKLVSVT